MRRPLTTLILASTLTFASCSDRSSSNNQTSNTSIPSPQSIATNQPQTQPSYTPVKITSEKISGNRILVNFNGDNNLDRVYAVKATQGNTSGYAVVLELGLGKKQFDTTRTIYFTTERIDYVAPTDSNSDDLNDIIVIRNEDKKKIVNTILGSQTPRFLD